MTFPQHNQPQNHDDVVYDKNTLQTLVETESPNSSSDRNFASSPIGQYGSTPSRRGIRGTAGKGVVTLKRRHDDSLSGLSPLPTPRAAFETIPMRKLNLPQADSPNKPSPGGVKFADRTNRNKSETALNEHLPLITRTTHDPSRKVSIKMASKQQMEPYRYMFQKISEKSEVLDERIDSFADIIQDKYDIAEIAHPGYPYQTTVTTVGRICCDSEATMNIHSVVLESSRALGSGCRVTLDLSGVPTFSVFPGQIVGIEGMNASGRCFTATKLLEIPLLPMARSTPKELLEMYYAPETENEDPSVEMPAQNSAILIVVAAGPYTVEDNIEFAPLVDLLMEVEKQRPDVLLLMGPFISEDHKLVQTGDLDVPPTELFASRVSTLLSGFCTACPSTTVVLVPSCKDIASQWCAMPQPPLRNTSDGSWQDAGARQEELLKLPSGVVCMPNPAQFYVNETLFAVSPTDILFHLSKEGKGRPSTSSDRLGQLARHVLEQRSFYPLFPPEIGEGFVDFGRLEQLELQATPDVLILASRMTYFAKVVEGVVVINPGFLTKKQAGGTYAVMNIHPPRYSDLRASLTEAAGGPPSEGVKMNIDAESGTPPNARGKIEGVQHDVASRARVEIRRV